MLDCIPQNIEIHLVIAMDKTVSHSGDLSPRNPRILSAPLRANPRSSLTDCLVLVSLLFSPVFFLF